MDDSIAITHNAAASRFEANVDGRLAVADYRIDGGLMIFTHTAVPRELSGRGLAEQLVRVGLAFARQGGYRVVTQCSYVDAFMRRNAEYGDLRA